MKRAGTDKTILGWSEYIGFPEWNIKRMKAKVDTGARSSALHVDNLVLLPSGRVRFEVVLSRLNSERRRTVTSRVLKKARVRSSNGHYTERYFVRCRVLIGSVEKEIELSLVSREAMVFRMLLGRTALEHDFLVDVSRRAHPRKAIGKG